ncbi:intraflagellar transport protein 27 homolog [Galendromus occidentalis]|uniref:Intraflagellar transport protein 27 homolog n=1 Tax=Galendromus occidentalis TaxID=34638 RepID=A0AAJ6QT38_9ACAR|nr:intraflagellar transport protein 27 homolog [Galendromus occidentalis]
MSNVLRTNCAIIGDSCVGKTSVINPENSGKNYEMTLGCKISVKSVRIPDTKYKVDIFVHDCSGKQLYCDILDRLWSDVTLIIVAYDVTSEASFRSVKDWHTRCTKATQEHPTFGVLLACKTDLSNRRTVTLAQGESLAKELGLQYFECSARDGSNLDASFFYLAHEWYKLYMEKVESFSNAQL